MEDALATIDMAINSLDYALRIILQKSPEDSDELNSLRERLNEYLIDMENKFMAG